MKKFALITGGAKRIGKSIALALSQKDVHIFLHYFHSSREAEETAAGIRQLGGTCTLLRANLQDEYAIKQLFQHIEDESGGLDVMINNASVFIKKSLDDTTLDDWQRIMQVNLTAPWLCAKYGRPLLLKHHGCILNILDSAIEKVWPDYAAYQISKVGLAQLTKLLAKTYAPEIRVNGIAPGLILPSIEEDQDRWQQLVERIPLKKQGEPSDIVDAVWFFINQAYITGEILFIDGGYKLS
jgi:pteridine reductase